MTSVGISVEDFAVIFQLKHASFVYVPLAHIFIQFVRSFTLGYVEEKTHKLCSLTLSGFNCGCNCAHCCC